MHTDFWHQRWQNQQIGFHLDHINPLLRDYFSHLNLKRGDRILLPLCGKTLDIHWLLAQEIAVVGVELSDIAVTSLFAELGLQPVITQYGNMSHFKCDQIEIWNGDFFALNAEHIGHVNAVYDRAALIALPAEMRVSYCQQLMQISAHARQLLISVDYDQSIDAGPPFAVNQDEICAHYGEHFNVALLANNAIAGGLKGQYPAFEQAWHLQPIAHASD